MITVHHLNNSRSQRILWLLEELGLKYEIKRYERNKLTMLAPKELREVHPLGKSPVITDGDITVAESGAIIEYLIETYGNGRLKPKAGTPEARQYTYFLHYAEGSAMFPFLMSLVFSKITGPPTPIFARPVAVAIAAGVKTMLISPQMKLHLEFMEGELSKREWFAGTEFSAADIQMSFPVEAAKSRASLDDKPKLKAFLERIHSRPAYQRALEAGGPFSMMS